MKQEYWVVGFAIASQLAGCSPEFRTCYTTRTCPPTGGTGGDAGTAGEAGANAGEGGSSGGDNAAAAGSTGEANEEGGAAGTAIAERGAAGEDGAMAPHCGDGNIDHAEMCDDGPNNGPGKACNAQCMRNVCGDGDKGPGEGCDDGVENGLGLLRCAPDCSRVIHVKHVIFSPKQSPNAQLAPNPVASADATCPTGYKAFFAFGASRRATTTALKAQNSIDWVIQPYTYYYNSEEKPVWLTDSVPLLGVRNGNFTALENRIAGYIAYVATGLNADYTTLATDNCQGWTALGYNMSYGLAGETSLRFITDATVECSNEVWFYCVEQ